MNWEGVQARDKGVGLRQFKLADYGAPYGYSPIILASKKVVKKQKLKYEAFLTATKEGYLFAKNEVSKAIDILSVYIPEHERQIDLLKSQFESIKAYGADDTWGKMDKKAVCRFLDWLCTHKLETTRLTYEDLVWQG